MIIFTNLNIYKNKEILKKKMKRTEPSKCIYDLIAGMTYNDLKGLISFKFPPK